MKEFMYSLALCVLLASGWSFRHTPSDEDIRVTARTDPALAATLEQQQRQMTLISGIGFAVAGALGVVGFFSKTRRQARAAQERDEQRNGDAGG
jgi:hypothetical protein